MSWSVEAVGEAFEKQLEALSNLSLSLSLYLSLYLGCCTWSVEAVGEALEKRFEASSSKLRRPKLLWSTNWQITEFVKNPTW